MRSQTGFLSTAASFGNISIAQGCNSILALELWLVDATAVTSEQPCFPHVTQLHLRMVPEA